MKKEWFEMEDIRSRSLARRSWIPICSYTTVKETGRFGHGGYLQELALCDSIMVPSDAKEDALKFEWMDVMVLHANGPWVDDDIYHIAGTFQHYESDIRGQYLVLRQRIDEELEEWHLDQDFVLGLKLQRKSDIWYSPEEDDIELVKLFRDERGWPIRLEVRAEHLRDYLCARGCGLLIVRYHQRSSIASSFPNIDWPESHTVSIENGLWEGRLRAIHEGGFSAGESMGVIRVSRHGPELQEDVPKPGFPTDDTTKSESWTKKPTGKVLTHAIGEFWRNDWVDPARISPRLRGDSIPSTTRFIVENDGSTMEPGQLETSIRWLWFAPSVVPALMQSRHGIISWYTGDTGGVGSRPSRSVHFGMNDLGLINVFAKDIALLPETDRKKWAAHNLTPEGGVSGELLQSQMKAKVAETIAPEKLLWQGLEYIQHIFAERYRSPLLRSLPPKDDFNKKINRFVANDQDGLYLLAKEITRVFADQINIQTLRGITDDQTKKLGSLKLLERLLISLSVDGHGIMGPLFAVYDLRQADAHPASTDLNEPMILLGIDGNEALTIKGKIMIHRIVNTLRDITIVISHG